MEKACHSHTLPERIIEDMFQGKRLVPRKKGTSILGTKVNDVVNVYI